MFCGRGSNRLSKRAIASDHQVRIRDSADGGDSELNPFIGNKRANHQYDQSILGKTEISPRSGTRPKSITINAIRYEPAIPAMPVSFKEVRIYTDEAIAIK
jgi:hypothetical protein